MLWLNFLHFYQPANIESYNIREALDKSYWRLIRLLEEHPKINFTFNITGCLLDRINEEGQTDFFIRLNKLIRRGQVELTGSAAYHGFLPLLPKTEVIQQIKENEKILHKYFGSSLKLRGFFLPEMAYSPEVAKIVKKFGYSWLILGESAYGGKTNQKPDSNLIYLDQVSKLKIIFRNRQLSLAYPPDKLLPIFTDVDQKKVKISEPFITASDAELYGLRHEDPTAELEKIVKVVSLKTSTISKYIQKFPIKKIKEIKIYSSSWESTSPDIKKGQPYRLWFDRKNKIQVELWKLARLSLFLGKKYRKDKNYQWHRWHLVRGLASCTFWWASSQDFSKVFGPYAWSPQDIERGLEDLIRSVRSFFSYETKNEKLLAEKHYLKIKKLIWEEHWKKHWHK